MTDFRALCLQFIEAVDRLCCHGETRPGHRLILTVDIEVLEELRDEARAALAEGETGPSDERNSPSWHELWDFVFNEHDIQSNPALVVAVVREALARWGSIPPRSVKPSGYAYRYPSIYGSVIRFNDGCEVNGSRPIEAVPYWLGQPTPSPESINA